MTSPVRFAFYGRSPREDASYSETTCQFQLHGARTILAARCPDAEMVETFFDSDSSKSQAWAAHPESARVLVAAGNADRGWDAVVVGEGKRCFHGAEVNEVAAVLASRGVPLYVPELDGRYDQDNAAHNVMMGVTGEMTAKS